MKLKFISRNNYFFLLTFLFYSSSVLSIDVPSLSSSILYGYDLNQDRQFNISEYKNILNYNKQERIRVTDSFRSKRDSSNEKKDITKYSSRINGKIIFRLLDKNNNQEISFSEFLHYQLPMFDNKKTKKIAVLKKNAFLSMDKDKNQGLSFSEFSSDKIIDFVFNYLDVDKNKKLSISEIKSF